MGNQAKEATETIDVPELVLGPLHLDSGERSVVTQRSKVTLPTG